MRLNIKTVGVAPAAVVLGLGLAFGVHPVNAAAIGVGDELLNSEAQVSELQGDVANVDDASSAFGADSTSNGSIVDPADSADNSFAVTDGNGQADDQIPSAEGDQSSNSVG